MRRFSRWGLLLISLVCSALEGAFPTHLDASSPERVRLGFRESGAACAWKVGLPPAAGGAMLPEIPLSYPFSRFVFPYPLSVEGKASDVRVVVSPHGRSFAVVDRRSIRVCDSSGVRHTFKEGDTYGAETLVRFTPDGESLLIIGNSQIEKISLSGEKVDGGEHSLARAIHLSTTTEGPFYAASAHYLSGEIVADVFEGEGLFKVASFRYRWRELGGFVAPPTVFTLSNRLQNGEPVLLLTSGQRIVVQEIKSRGAQPPPRLINLSGVHPIIDSKEIQGLALSPDGNRLAIKVAKENALHIWNIAGISPRSQSISYLGTTNPAPTSLSFSRDGDYVYALDGGKLNYLEVVDARSAHAPVVARFEPASSSDTSPFQVLRLFEKKR